MINPAETSPLELLKGGAPTQYAHRFSILGRHARARVERARAACDALAGAQMIVNGMAVDGLTQVLPLDRAIEYLNLSGFTDPVEWPLSEVLKLKANV